MTERIALALSGGIDSSVAAWLLSKERHELFGVSMIIWPSSHCCDTEAIDDARTLANFLGIPYRTYELIPEFREAVVKPFCQSYLQGSTPNPCAICNRHLKFGALFELAQRDLGVTSMATGHYARVRQDPETGRWQLLRGLDPTKDQSYVLYDLGQEQLSRTRFPVGELSKVEVRRLASEARLPLAPKRESQDACFTEGDTAAFLEAVVGDQIEPGPIVDLDGKVLGEHRGVVHYTVGQRRGLGPGGTGGPLYVVRIDAAQNRLVVGPRVAIFERSMRCAEFRWVSIERPQGPISCQVKPRYRSTPAPAQLFPEGEGCRIVFDEAQPALSPGQVAVAYEGDLLLGGGLISTVQR